MLALEFRHFNNNPKGKAFFTTGSSTKARETFDYKIKFKQGEYNYLDPVIVAKKGKDIDILPPEYLVTPTQDNDEFDIENPIDSLDE